jgi:hypothetical protein
MARDGWDLVVASRDGAALAALAAELGREHGVKALPVAADLSTPAGVSVLREAIGDRGLAVDALVNNAGYGAHGAFSSSDPANMSGMVALNVAALADLTRMFLPGMVERGQGRVMNVSSIASFVPGPYMAVYHATKAFVTSFSEALAEELRGTGVTVTALCPGPVRTGFAARAGAKEFSMYRFMEVSPAYCAMAGYRGMMKGKRIVVPGFLNRAVIALSRFSPRGAVARVVGEMQKKR